MFPARHTHWKRRVTVAELVSQLSELPSDAVVLGSEDANGLLLELTGAELVRVKPRGECWAPAVPDDPLNRLGVWLKQQDGG
jgi:hypothetical protein